MPETSVNEPLDPETQSSDVIITIDPPEGTSVSPQEQEQLRQNDPTLTSSLAAEIENEKENPTSSASISVPLEECRICLMSDEVGELIKPCHCIGSVQYAHLKCLKLWVHERADLHCEICKSMYAEEILPELEPDLRIGLEERSRRAHRHPLSAIDREMGAIHHPTAAELREEQPDTKRFWLRAVCITVPITVLVIMLLFLGMNANDSEWAAILLRLLAFALPTFIVLRIVWTCWGVARSGRGYDDDRIRRGVGV